jgi:hypothetical protein
MQADAFLQFARRDWAAVEASKLDHWAEEYKRHGGAPARAAATALLNHVRRMQPAYPTAEDRADDLAHHLFLRERLDRAAGAFSRR